MKVQSADIAGAYSDYEQALADETLAKAQLDRSKILFEKGAIAQKDLEVAQDTETKAKSPSRPRSTTCACWARIRITHRPLWKCVRRWRA
jgi:multidrug resistance efflux pump